MFSWNELVALSLVDILSDVELVIFMMATIKPLRRKFIEEESREWHQSLRITSEERCDIVMRRKRHILGLIPTGCDSITVPFDFRTSRISERLMENISFLRDDFIRIRVIETENIDNMNYEDTLAKTNEKIYITNLIFEGNYNRYFPFSIGYYDIYNAYKGYIEITSDPLLMVDVEVPYICHFERKYNDNNYGECIMIVN